jgi:GT2 family glycosyltransferase
LRISALIGTRNRPEALLRCVRSLQAQLRPLAEILVLDDASDTVDVRTHLAANGMTEENGVRVHRSNEPLGVGRGRNVLLARATGDAFLVLDDDAWIADEEFTTLLERELVARPEAAILAAKILDQRADGEHVLAPFPRRARNADPRITDHAQRVSYFLGGGHVLRRNAYERVRGYDDAFVWGEEELDLAFRVISAGGEVHYVPSLVVHHRAEPAVLRSAVQPKSELYFHVRNRFVLARKFLPARYFVPYLATWMARHAVDAIRTGDPFAYLGGIGAGAAAWFSTTRTPLDRRALRYLGAHHGRIWY